MTTPSMSVDAGGGGREFSYDPTFLPNYYYRLSFFYYVLYKALPALLDSEDERGNPLLRTSSVRERIRSWGRMREQHHERWRFARVRNMHECMHAYITVRPPSLARSLAFFLVSVRSITKYRYEMLKLIELSTL